MSVNNSKQSQPNNIMPTIIGRFFFKKTSNGNLIGEFSNRQSAGIYTESSDLIGNDSGYIGKYYSTWQEEGESLFANLEILQKPQCNNKIFTLEWRRGGQLKFEGEGMLCDDILIGDYHSVP
jgi:hypothetical protein